MKKVLSFIKASLIVIIMLAVMLFMFYGAALQTSYRYCPPSEDEIAQMGWFERFCYGD